jgi:hypothetical protein
MCVITQNKITSGHKMTHIIKNSKERHEKAKIKKLATKTSKIQNSCGEGQRARMKMTQSKEEASIYGVDDRSQCVTFSSALGNQNLTTFREIMKMEKSSWGNTR